VWGEFGPKGPPAMAEFGGYKFLFVQTAQLRPMSAADLSKLARQKHIKYKCNHLYNSK